MTDPRLSPHQTRVAAFFWHMHKIGTSEIADKLGVSEASVSNSMEAIMSWVRKHRQSAANLRVPA